MCENDGSTLGVSEKGQILRGKRTFFLCKTNGNYFLEDPDADRNRVQNGSPSNKTGRCGRDSSG